MRWVVMAVIALGLTADAFAQAALVRCTLVNFEGPPSSVTASTTFDAEIVDRTVVRMLIRAPERPSSISDLSVIAPGVSARVILVPDVNSSNGLRATQNVVVLRDDGLLVFHTRFAVPSAAPPASWVTTLQCPAQR